MSTTVAERPASESRPAEQQRNEPAIAPLLRTDRLPNVWCPMCGIGTVVKCYATALQRRGVDHVEGVPRRASGAERLPGR